LEKPEIEQLEEVLRSDGEDTEFTAAVSTDFYDESNRAAEDDIADEFFAKYEALVRRFAGSWGPPGFDDGMANPTFPKWYEAEFLACWPKGERVAYVALRREDRELPFELVYGVRRAAMPKGRSKMARKHESEAADLTKTLGGRQLCDVRWSAQGDLVFEFEGKKNVIISPSGKALKVTLCGTVNESAGQ
jgi:hypothetical protein